MLHLAFGNRPEEHHGIGNPHHGDQDIDRPLQLGVFLAGGVAQRQCDGRQHDDQLPTPEHEGRQLRQEQPGMASALHHIQRSAHQCTTTKRKDHRVGVKRAQAPKMQILAQIQFGPDKLRGNDDADQHAYDAPNDCHDRELPHDLIVVSRLGLHKPPR